MSIVETVRSRLQTWQDDFPRRYIDRLEMQMRWAKRLYGDTTPVTDHIRGQVLWARSRIFGGSQPTSPAGLESRRNGIRLLGQLVPDSVMKPITAKLAEAFSKPRHDDYYYKGALATRSLIFATREVPELVQLLTPALLDAVRGYYGCNFQLTHLSAWRNYAVPPMTLAEEAYSNNWHTDGRRIDMLKVWIAGTDVSMEDGPTHAMTREWTHEIVKRGYNDRRAYDVPVETIENPEHMVRLTGPAGVALLCNSNLCFHRAGIIGEGRYRDLIELRFFSSTTTSLEMPDDATLPWRDRILR
jgi:hypothetical protein